MKVKKEYIVLALVIIGLSAYLYLRKGERIFWWLRSARQQYIPRKRPAKKDMDVQDFIRSEVDPILDKAAKHGIHSLTRKERKILREASSRFEDE